MWPRELVNAAASLRRRPRNDLWLVAEAVRELAWCRWSIRRTGLRAVSSQADPMVESQPAIPARETAIAERVGWAVRGSSRFTPWQSNCFPQALAAQRMLGRRSIESTIYFGASLSADVADRDRETATMSLERFAAHAWTRCGEAIITGGATADDYEALAWYCTRTDRQRTHDRS